MTRLPDEPQQSIEEIQEGDWDSIRRGLADRAQRNELPLAEADTQMRKELGFPLRTSDNGTCSNPFGNSTHS